MSMSVVKLEVDKSQHLRQESTIYILVIVLSKSIAMKMGTRRFNLEVNLEIPLTIFIEIGMSICGPLELLGKNSGLDLKTYFA